MVETTVLTSYPFEELLASKASSRHLSSSYSSLSSYLSDAACSQLSDAEQTPLDGAAQSFTAFFRADKVADVLSAFKSLKAEAERRAMEEGETCCCSHRDEPMQRPKRRRALHTFCVLKRFVGKCHYQAERLFATLDEKVNHPDSVRMQSAMAWRSLIVGAGISGLTTAIEMCLIGCESVAVIEKRTVFDRRNIIHLWPQICDYLKSIGFKTMYPRLLTGGLDCVPIRRMQMALLKVALLLGTDVTMGVAYERSQPDAESQLFRAETLPEMPSLSPYNILVGAEGERSRVLREFNFERKELVFGQALGITANFQSTGSPEEKALAEGGFVSYLNRDFFGKLKSQHIELENLVMYQAPEQPPYAYFVMTAKAASLVAHGVLKDHNDLTTDTEQLCAFVRKVVTAYGLPECCAFLQRRSGRPDVQLFDFSHKSAAVAPSQVIHRDGTTCLVAIVGDAAINPFWPKGTGAAQSVMAALDFTHLVRRMDDLSLISEPCLSATMAEHGEEVDTLLRTHEQYHVKLQTSTTANVKGICIDPTKRYTLLY